MSQINHLNFFNIHLFTPYTVNTAIIELGVIDN